MDSIPFLIALGAHFISLLIGMGAVLTVDAFGLLWLFKKASMPFLMRIAGTTQKLIWIGWIGLVLSGTVLIVLKGYIDNLTVLKLFFVALVGANGVFLHVIKKSLDVLHHGDQPSSHLKFRIILATTISQIGWWSAISIGFLHSQWRHRIDWPNAPEIYIACITVSILLLALVGETIFGDKASHKSS